MIDLHVHSNYSDGNKSVQELVNISKSRNIQTISLTDHNTIKNLDILRTQDIDYIKGIELCPLRKDTHGFHMLAYDFDLNKSFLELMDELDYERLVSMKKKIKIINDYYNTSLDVSALDQTWLSNQSLYLYLKKEFDLNTTETMLNYLSNFNIKINKKVDYLRLLKTILSSNGIPVLAHPKSVKCDDFDFFLKDLKNNGLMGIEAYHPSHNLNDIMIYLDYAKKYELLISGGSDYHGYNKKDFNGNEIELGYFNDGKQLDDVSILKYIRGRKNV